MKAPEKIKYRGQVYVKAAVASKKKHKKADKLVNLPENTGK